MQFITSLVILYNEFVLDGTFYIVDVNNNNHKLANNAIVEYGHHLRIQATPANMTYYAEYKVSDMELDAANTKNTSNAKFKTSNIADVFVDQDRTITVSFLTDDPWGYTIKLQALSDITSNKDWSDIIKTVTLDGTNTSVNGKISDAFVYNAAKIQAGKL